MLTGFCKGFLIQGRHPGNAWKMLRKYTRKRLVNVAERRGKCLEHGQETHGKCLGDTCETLGKRFSNVRETLQKCLQNLSQAMLRKRPEETI